MAVPVINQSQMREWEQATWAGGQTEAEVIRRVGERVAARALQLTGAGDLILILAGKGHNGDDARCAREHLPNRQVELIEVREPEVEQTRLTGVLARRPALVIDGLFGIGLDRPLEGAWAQFIESVNQAQLPVLAVDVPSGLNADSGEPQGGAIRAASTLSVGAPKQGLLTEAAWPYVGRLEVTPDVGLGPCPCASELHWTQPEDFHGYPPARLAATHKGSYGHLGIIAGSLGYHGAAVLAARGAQRAQPGLITLQTLESVYHAIAPQLQSVMVSVWQPVTKMTTPYSGLLIGPGLAASDMPDQMKLLTRHLWRDSLHPVIVDASALDWVPLDPVPRNVIRVLTPHPGEAARLLRASPAQIQANRLNAIRNISRRFANAWVVLKGHQTMIGRSTGEVFVNCSGNPHLAQGGSGDVLAGFLAGLLAQPALQADPLRTLRYGVWEHGAAADRLQARRRNWVIEDLAAEIGQGSIAPY
jgi:NAD(P)H-hydrate epimerase